MTLNQGLVVGCCIREMLTIKEIVAIDEKGTHLDGVVEFFTIAFLILLAMIVDIINKLWCVTTVSVDTQIDTEASACCT